MALNSGFIINCPDVVFHIYWCRQCIYVSYCFKNNGFPTFVGTCALFPWATQLSLQCFSGMHLQHRVHSCVIVKFSQILGGIYQILCVFMMAFIRMVMFSRSWGVAVEVTILTYILLGDKLLPSLHFHPDSHGNPSCLMPHKYPQQEKQQELRPYWGTMMIQSNLLNILFLGKLVALRRMFGTCCISIS